MEGHFDPQISQIVADLINRSLDVGFNPQITQITQKNNIKLATDKRRRTPTFWSTDSRESSRESAEPKVSIL